ncbi:FHA domain-containing protein [Neoactinobaculum massilliense]|uniref:FHA domain-containing protein n=1 Tax=Neoactinobaculum massilliense TaxID=2364794 RepID=UPI000F538B9D|nr:FHA domain-containing protein [Neoactinobaculum massilliense]
MSEQFDPHNGAESPTSTSTFQAIGSRVEQPNAPRTLSPDEVSALQGLPKGSALLFALSGPNEGARFLLNSEITNVGRSPRADIFLDDVTVSRKHARFIRMEGHFSIRDSGSLNGTYVNRNRVDGADLHDSDEIQIGKFRLTFYSSRAV